ncbi:MAG: molybdopterin-binding protein [Alphaproteobacteria bacterium]|jgi:molybdenum cofactor synthesis domain-containing protein|nr:molybdopterin-binding protein [Alphaproteobacteria bacterium]MDP6517584.1 molybdopterin-binding protein [Alphaproteobacteria bacterium]
MTDSARPTACVLIIGNEILTGRTQDVNLAFLATRLTEIGVRLAEARVIADDEDVIVATLNQCRAAHTYVFTTGGIGPTHDDITAASVAKAFGVALEQHAEARRRLAELCERNGVELNAARLRMANVPAGGRLIDNPVSAAPGFQIENVFVFAGIPSIMQAMFEGCKGRLVGGPPVLSRTVVGYMPEGTVAAPLSTLQDQYPDVEIGSYPFYRAGRFGTSLVLRGADAERLSAATAQLAALVTDLGGAPEIDPD